jgi:RNA polymerase sigma-70 factor, ECF subfamily
MRRPKLLNIISRKDNRKVFNYNPNTIKFELVYNAYYPRVLNYIRSKLIGEEEAAEDVTSETFEKIYNNLEGFKWQGVQLSSWIFRIANNTLIDYYRKKKVKSSSGIIENFEDHSVKIEQEYEKSDTAAKLKFIIEKLKPREKQIIIMKFYEGYTNKKISETLNITETNVSTIINRTLIKIKNLYN